MKKQTKVMMGVAAGLLCIVLIGGGIAAYSIINSPTRILMSAATGLLGEWEKADQKNTNKPDMEKLLTIYQTGDYKADFNITMQNRYFDTDTTLNGNCEYDTTNKKMKFKSSVAAKGTELVNMEVYMDGKNMYMLYPDWFKGSFVMSAEEYSEGVLPEPSDDVMETAGFAKEIGGQLIQCMTSAEVKKADGREGSYQITIPKDKVKSIGGLEVQSDLNFLVQVENKNEITQITNEGMPCQIEEIGNVMLKTDFRRQNGELTSYEMVVGTEEISVDYTYLFEDAHSDLELIYKTEDANVKLVFWGSVTGEGDVITMNTEGLRIYIDEEQSVSMDGLVHLMPLTEEIEKPDTEPEYNPLTMTEEDYMELIMQMGDKITNLF